MIRWAAAFSVVCIFAGMFAVNAAAHEPLYRYALRHTSPSPYEIYQLSNEPPSVVTLLFHENVHHSSGPGNGRLNVAFSYVNVPANPELSGLPFSVRRIWFEKSNRTLPMFLFVSPQGVELASGALSPDDVRRAAESTVGNRLVRQLSSHDGICLLLLSAERRTAEDRQLAKSLQQLLSDLRKPTAATATEPMASPSLLPSTLDVGFLHIERHALPRDWCERSIQAILPPATDPHTPTAMIVFGRGRALPVRSGSNITREALVRDLTMLTAPFDPAENKKIPGTDLLLNADWEKIERQEREKSATADRIPPVVATPSTATFPIAAPEAAPATSPTSSPSAQPKSEPTKVTAFMPVQNVIPEKQGMLANSENVTATGIVAALLCLFVLTFSILRPQ